MTVCIAAVCTFPAGGLGIIACSDRMLTAGLTEFQPAQAKYYGFAPMVPSTVALVAGGIGPQIMVCDATFRRLASTPSKLTRIVAGTYAEEFMAYQRELAQQEVLSVFGLTHDSFIARQLTMSPDFIRRIESQLGSIPVGTETIIAGTDAEGAHLYVVHDRAHITGSDSAGVVHSEDASGFAAIGSGAMHAHSEFTIAEYSRSWSLARALNLLYEARRAAEAAPGVGDEADWYMIPPNGVASLISGEVIDAFAKEYERTDRAAAKRAEQSDARMEEFISRRLSSLTPPPPPESPASEPPPASKRGP